MLGRGHAGEWTCLGSHLEELGQLLAGGLKALEAVPSAGESVTSILQCRQLTALHRPAGVGTGWGHLAPQGTCVLSPPAISLPLSHVDVAEEAILSGLGTAQCGPVKLLHHRPQDAGAGLPESLGGVCGGVRMTHAEGGTWGTRCEGSGVWVQPPCPVGLTARPSGVEKSRSSRSASLSRGRSRSWRVPFTRATSAASARPPLWGHRGDPEDPMGMPWGP